MGATRRAENFIHAFAVIDASACTASPTGRGTGHPARGELYLAPQMSYHVDDVLGLRTRALPPGKLAIVIGAGRVPPRW